MKVIGRTRPAGKDIIRFTLDRHKPARWRNQGSSMKNKTLSVKEIDLIQRLGYTIRSRWIGPVEGYEYKVAKMGSEIALAYRKSSRAAFNFIVSQGAIQGGCAEDGS
jgi:hypothetical protein